MWRSTTLTVLLGLASLFAASSAAAAPGDLARWPVDEGSGQVASDVSGNGHHARLGSLAGPDSNDPGWVPGRFGTALRFDGRQDQFAEIAEPATLTPAVVTVEAWVRRLGTPGMWRYVLSNRAQGCDFSSFGLYTGAGGGLAFYVSDGGGYVLSPAAQVGQVWDGRWHHAVGTFDGHHVRLFVDGAEVGQGAAGVSINYALGSPGALIGTYRGTCALPFTGDVDELAIRDRALGADEIAALAAEAAQRPEPPQVPPVGGPPAGESPAVTPDPPEDDAPPIAQSCFTVRVSPGRVVARRRTRLRIVVRRSGRAVVGARVTLRGLGVRATARTRRAGRARVVVRSRRSGRLRVTVRGQPPGCAAKLLTVRRQRAR